MRSRSTVQQRERRRESVQDHQTKTDQLQVPSSSSAALMPSSYIYRLLVYCVPYLIQDPSIAHPASRLESLAGSETTVLNNYILGFCVPKFSRKLPAAPHTLSSSSPCLLRARPLESFLHRLLHISSMRSPSPVSKSRMRCFRFERKCDGLKLSPVPQMRLKCLETTLFITLSGLCACSQS